MIIATGKESDVIPFLGIKFSLLKLKSQFKWSLWQVLFQTHLFNQSENSISLGYLSKLCPYKDAVWRNHKFAEQPYN